MMKRILSVFLICLLLTGCGQGYEGETVPKQVVTSMTTEYWYDAPFDQFHTTSIQEYDYDEYGRLISEKWITNGETALSSRYFWSGDGRECTQWHFDHQGLIPWPDSRVKEVYGENGKVTERIVYELFSVSQRSIYNYDDADNLIRLETTDGEGNTTILQEYRCDENGNRIMTIDMSEPGMERITEYSYDSDGNQIGWRYTENGALVEYVESFYDDQGRSTFSARYNALGEQQYYWEYSYSADGSSMTTSYSGERSRIEYFDGSALPIRIENYDGDGNLTGITTYTYGTIQVPKEPNP